MTRVLEVKRAESARVFGGSERPGVGRRRLRRAADRPRPASSIRGRAGRARLLYIFFAFRYLLTRDPPLSPPAKVAPQPRASGLPGSRGGGRVDPGRRSDRGIGWDYVRVRTPPKEERSKPGS